MELSKRELVSSELPLHRCNVELLLAGSLFVTASMLTEMDGFGQIKLQAAYEGRFHLALPPTFSRL